jgi:hypothetical protein
MASAKSGMGCYLLTAVGVCVAADPIRDRNASGAMEDTVRRRRANLQGSSIYDDASGAARGCGLEAYFPEGRDCEN